MNEPSIIEYQIKEPIELNLSFMPFIHPGGLLIPNFDIHSLGEFINIILTIQGKKDPINIEGKIVWITPSNALHHVLPGIGVQFIGSNASSVRTEIETYLDKSMQNGGYTYGTTDEMSPK